MGGGATVYCQRVFGDVEEGVIEVRPLMNDFNKNELISVLSEVVGFLVKRDANYRLLGSVVMAAINGGLYRRVGDVDLILDTNLAEDLMKKLKSEGFYEPGGIFALGRKYIRHITLAHDKKVELGIFYGEWNDNGNFEMTSKCIKLVIESRALIRKRYALYGIKFDGLEERVIATGVHNSKRNPKRHRELEILKVRGIEPEINDYIHLYLFGLKTDWLYHLVMSALNVLGVVRVRLGMTYDPWR